MGLLGIIRAHAKTKVPGCARDDKPFGRAQNRNAAAFSMWRKPSVCDAASSISVVL